MINEKLKFLHKTLYNYKHKEPKNTGLPSEEFLTPALAPQLNAKV
jgi:hypothetical protein